MKRQKFDEWLLEVGSYNQQIDGPALSPTNASQAHDQIMQLAFNIRTTLGHSSPGVMKCSELLEQAAAVLSQEPEGEETPMMQQAAWNTNMD